MVFWKREDNRLIYSGGGPLLHPNLNEIINVNRNKKIKTTIYTNGYFLNNFLPNDFRDVKLRVSLYCKNGQVKSVNNLPKSDIAFDANFMVSSKTSLQELLDSAKYIEDYYNCKTFFISSIRELDNPRKEFFDDTPISMPVLKYKELVHNFLNEYPGNMQVHVSKRGVFESTITPADNKCRFANYFVGGKIIQCPYDVVNLKFQRDYFFGERYCQQNNSCLMSKLIFVKK